VTISIGALGQKVLRRLGVRIVPLADSPHLTELVPMADLAAKVLLELGVVNANGTAFTETVNANAIATGALVDLGVLNSDMALVAPPIVPVNTIATNALIELGIVNTGAPGEPGDIQPYQTIATLALQELGIIAADEVATTYDNGLALEAVTSIHAALWGEGIAQWTLTTIPRLVSEDYIWLTSFALAPAFGKVYGDIQQRAAIEARIRVVSQIMTGDLTYITSEVIGVHASLQARGIALWASGAIPKAVAEEYTKLTAAYAAAVFGKPADLQAIGAIEERIRAAAQVLNADPAFMSGKVRNVHGSLVELGIASWDVEHIPRGYAEQYIKLTAAYSAAAFGKPVDMQLVQLLEGQIRKAAQLQAIDAALVLDKLQSIYAALDAQGIVWWAGDAVPRAFVEEFIKLATAWCSASIERPTDLGSIAALEGRVRKGAMVISGDDWANAAVQAVHDDLVARGIARWTVHDIPEHVGEAYVLIATPRLAPLFGMAANMGEARQGEVAIFRYVALGSSGEPMVASYF